jgi:hypothetical protein
MKLELGQGNVICSFGNTGGKKCLVFEITKNPHPVGTKRSDEWFERTKTTTESEVDLLITFDNLESLRVLQDTVNELACKWVNETAPRVEE